MSLLRPKHARGLAFPVPQPSIPQGISSQILPGSSCKSWQELSELVGAWEGSTPPPSLHGLRTSILIYNYFPTVGKQGSFRGRLPPGNVPTTTTTTTTSQIPHEEKGVSGEEVSRGGGEGMSGRGLDPGLQTYLSTLPWTQAPAAWLVTQ